MDAYFLNSFRNFQLQPVSRKSMLIFKGLKSGPELTYSYCSLLSPVYSATVDRVEAQRFYPAFSTLHKVAANKTSLVIHNLEKFALYEVAMWTEGVNSGRSLPTYTIKVVTHIEGEQASMDAVAPPSLPDVQACCISKNVSHNE